MGTDHGDAAPLILFGSCISTGIIGSNPQIPNQINNQAGLPMAIDFRDVYASILKDWFEVDTNVIQGLFEQNISYISLLQGCTNDITEQEDGFLQQKSMVFPNPTLSKNRLKFMSKGENYEIFLVTQQSKIVSKVMNGFIQSGESIQSFDVTFLPTGTYYYLLKSSTHQELVSFQKI